MRFRRFREWRPYKSVARRQLEAEREMAKLAKKGHPVSPVRLEGKAIATTFWGKAWCQNLESYSDYANRLPRGRSYVRNGSVVDLQIAAGEVTARVAGSALYEVTLKVVAVPPALWKSVCKDCAGGIDSLVELLQGRLSDAVMERICRQRTGLFPAPTEITLACSCPDWATMCKHVAAVLYGVGARLDHEPQLLFKLRRVDENELIAQAGVGVPLARKGPAAKRVLERTELADIFGVEMAGAAVTAKAAPKKPAARSSPTKPKAARKQPTHAAKRARAGRA